MYALCDCNNFYASCERVFNPSLQGKPILVLSGNDGCVIARSNETKTLGIKMGEPYFKIKKLVRAHDIKIFSTNFELYGDLSSRVMQTLTELAPKVEIYSIDEAFMLLEGFSSEQLKDFGAKATTIVKRNTGIPVSVGISHTKTLAKIASRLCKLYPKLDGSCLMERAEDIDKVLSWYPIGDVWGVGRRTVPKLANYGVRTAKDFCRLTPELVRNIMGLGGLRTWKELHGEPCMEFEDMPSPRQSIMVSRSFAQDIYDPEALARAVSTFASRAAQKLRQDHQTAGSLQVFLHTNIHRGEALQHHPSARTAFLTPTNSTLEIVKESGKLLSGLIHQDCGYKRAGVLLCDLVPEGAVQSSLFDTTDRGAHQRLMESLDAINSSMGRGVLRLASDGVGALDVRSDHLSPRYTTSWDEIMVVKV